VLIDDQVEQRANESMNEWKEIHRIEVKEWQYLYVLTQGGTDARKPQTQLRVW
jgi:hypothetical protein